jgi:hypothetical protein
LTKLPKGKADIYSSMENKACVLTCKGTIMKQFEYLTHTPDFIREIRKDSRGILVEYDELKELGRQGWELVTAQPGGKWIFKREADEGPETAQGKSVKPPSSDYDRSR